MRRFPLLSPLLLVMAVTTAGAAALDLVRSRPRPRPRYDVVRAETLVACEAYRADPRHRDTPVCVPGASRSTGRLFEDGRGAMNTVKTALAAGDGPTAREALARALRVADEADRRGTMVSGAWAANLVREALDAVERRPDVFDAVFVDRALRGVELTAGTDPYRGDTLDASFAALARVDEAGPVLGDLVAPYVAYAVADQRATRRAMADAVAAHDVARCRVVAERRARTFVPFGLSAAADASLCPNMAKVVLTRERLERVRHDMQRRART